MKKIVFLIIATLLVIGLVLPGCGGPGPGGGFTDWIDIGVVAPMSVVHGQQEDLCADWAAAEINAAGGINVSGTVYGIRITTINTLTEETPSLAVAALQAVIDDVHYVIGGFRTETVYPLVETTMDESKLFIISGAATAGILRQVAWNDTRYQYTFRGTPFNDVFLLTNMYKFMGTLAAMYSAHNVSPPFKFAALAENLAWTATMRYILANDVLGVQAALGYTNATIVTCSPTATSLVTELQSIAGSDPILLMPILSAAACGAAYSSDRLTYVPNATSFGINVYGQVEAAYSGTSGAILGEAFLDSYGDGCNQTSTTAAFLSGFATRCTLASGDYPMYTATMYDVIHGLALDIDAAQSIASGDLVTQLRSGRFYETAGAKNSGYYPMPAITLVAGNSSATKVMCLNASQAYGLYPHLVEYYNALGKGPYANYAAMEAAWMGDSLYADWTSNPGGIVPNDLIYGPGYVTGLITQWQNVTGAGKKVAVWPSVPPGLGALANLPAHSIYLYNATTFNSLVAAGLIDEYGSWIIDYPGTEPVQIPTNVYVHHGGF